MKLGVIIICIAVIFLVEHGRCSHYDSLMKDKKEITKKQKQKRCPNCLSTDFEVVGMKHGKLLWLCKHCKKIRK